MTDDARTPMTGPGYDYPVQISTLPIGTRFADYLEVPAWGIYGRLFTGTVLWVGTGSVEVWFDHEKSSSRVASELDVYLLDEQPLGTTLIEQLWRINPMSEATATKAAENDNIKKLVTRYNFQLNLLRDALEGDDKAKASINMMRIQKVINEARQMHIKLPDPPAALQAYEPLLELLTSEAEKSKADAEERAAAANKRAAHDNKLTERDIAREKHQTETAMTKASTSRSSKPKGDKKMRPCLDGCGAMVAGNFLPGHDARLKSLLLKIERGDVRLDALPEPCLDLVKVIKAESIQERDSEGNAKGEPKETFRITQAPVKFPGRPDITLTTRED